MTASGVLVVGDATNPASPEPVLRLLGNPLKLESGVSLGSFCQLFKRYPSLQEVTPLTAPFVDLFSGFSGPSDPKSPIRLELSRTIEMQGYPGEPRVHIFLTLKTLFEGEIQSIDLFSPSDLFAMPFGLGRLRHIVFGDLIHSETFATEYSLFEVLDGLMWELSFYWDKSRCGIRGP